MLLAHIIPQRLVDFRNQLAGAAAEIRCDLWVLSAYDCSHRRFSRKLMMCGYILDYFTAAVQNIAYKRRLAIIDYH